MQQQKYFAASNSAYGFKNYYSEVFERADRVYVIKGGPGTGKSSFMKKCGRAAQERGYSCEYYFCSSDPQSLDGILIFEKNAVIGVLDGTFPHVCEPKYPGARDEIINFARFWDSALLYGQKNEITSLSERKSTEYNHAYTYLRSVGNLRAVNDSLIRDAVDDGKLIGAVERVAKLIKDDDIEYGTVIPAITGSVSMYGCVRLDTFKERAEKLYCVSNSYGVGEMFLDALLEKLKKKRVTVRASFDPICPEHIDGIFVEKCNVGFVLCEPNKRADENGSDIWINTKRFLDSGKLREVRGDIRYTAKLAASSLDGALHSLAKARVYHFLLEDIYGKAMDWKSFGKTDVDSILSY